jgi:competence protein ComEA
MLNSLLLKLSMLVMTMGIVFWIGWTMPESRYIERAHQLDIRRNEVNPVRSPAASAGSASTIAPSLDRLSSASRQTVVEHLDLNRATEHELEALPGIGPVLAGRIVQYRRAQGAFGTIDQLRQVKGIGKKTLDRIRPLVQVTGPPVSAPGGRKTT